MSSRGALRLARPPRSSERNVAARSVRAVHRGEPALPTDSESRRLTLAPSRVPTVSAEWLVAHADDARLRVLCVVARDAAAERSGEVPGAVLVAIDAVRDPTGSAAGSVAPPWLFASAMVDAGLDDASLVVAYDHVGGELAAELVRALRRYGHDDAAVLAGGVVGWKAAGHPTAATSAAVRSRAGFTARVARGDLASK